MSIHRRSLAWLIPALLIPVLVTACVTTTNIELNRDPDSGDIGVTVTVTIETGSSSMDANSIWQTREVDPTLLANDSGYPHAGTITLNLENGTSVSYSQGLEYDSGTSVSPIRTGHQALVYRPENPQNLQSFLDQYWDQAVSGTIVSNVGLEDNSSSSESTIVDVQGAAESQTQYLGSGSVTTEGDGSPLQKDF